MRFLISIFIICISLLSFSSDITFPKLKGRVNDYANVISDPEENHLKNILKQHEDSTSNQIVILTVKNLQAVTIEEFSIEVAEYWKLGTKEKDNGVLILIAPSERKMRIEVGRGLEGVLTDALCKRIIENEFIPYFKRNNYEAGISAGTGNVIKAIAGNYIYDDEITEYNDELGLGEKFLIGGIFGTFTNLFLLVFAIQAIIKKSIWLKFFTILWYGIFCFVLTIAVHWFFLILFTIYFLFIISTFIFPIRKWLLQKKWAQKISGAKKLSSGGWYVPSKSSTSFGGSSSSFSGGGGSFSGGGSSGSW